MAVSYMKEGEGFLCLCDLTSRESFDDLDLYVNTVYQLRSEGLFVLSVCMRVSGVVLDIIIKYLFSKCSIYNR